MAVLVRVVDLNELAEALLEGTLVAGKLGRAGEELLARELTALCFELDRVLENHALRHQKPLQVLGPEVVDRDARGRLWRRDLEDQALREAGPRSRHRIPVHRRHVIDERGAGRQPEPLQVDRTPADRHVVTAADDGGRQLATRELRGVALADASDVLEAHGAEAVVVSGLEFDDERPGARGGVDEQVGGRRYDPDVGRAVLDDAQRQQERVSLSGVRSRKDGDAAGLVRGEGGRQRAVVGRHLDAGRAVDRDRRPNAGAPRHERDLDARAGRRDDLDGVLDARCAEPGVRRRDDPDGDAVRSVGDRHARRVRPPVRARGVAPEAEAASSVVSGGQRYAPPGRKRERRHEPGASPAERRDGSDIEGHGLVGRRSGEPGRDVGRQIARARSLEPARQRIRRPHGPCGRKPRHAVDRPVAAHDAAGQGDDGPHHRDDRGDQPGRSGPLRQPGGRVEGRGRKGEPEPHGEARR